MHGNLQRNIEKAREIERQFRQLEGPTDVFVSPLFPKWARDAWPTKTAAHVAAIAGVSERAGARWLSGEIEPPAVVVISLMQRMMQSYRPQR